jgi:hypothetical protein
MHKTATSMNTISSNNNTYRALTSNTKIHNKTDHYNMYNKVKTTQFEVVRQDAGVRIKKQAMRALCWCTYV